MDTEELTPMKKATKPPHPFILWIKTPKGKAIAISVVVVIALGSAGAAAYQRYAKKSTATTIDANGNEVAVNYGATANANVAANLDGTMVSADLAKRRPLAIMVENHPEARPQAGLGSASVVFEAITEGGITRFEAIFGPRDVSKVGPVRSARPYFVQYASGFHAIYAHAGGSEAGLALLKTAPVINLDNTANYFWREPKAGLASEHTLYTSTDNLYKLAKTRGASLTDDIQPWKFADDPDTANRPASQSATIDFSSASYKASWAYDTASNSYKRSMAGAVHKDANTNEQIAAKNVVIMTVKRQQNASANHGKGEWTMDTIGSGTVKVLKNGTITEGTWKKTAIDAMVRFYDSSDKEISLSRGLSWLEIVPPDSTVTIQ